jgi:hypothetical protein
MCIDFPAAPEAGLENSPAEARLSNSAKEDSKT